MAWIKSLLFFIFLTVNINFANGADFLTQNCRFYCEDNFIICVDKIIEKSSNRTKKQIHRAKNSCYSNRSMCHEKCTKQEISLKRDKEFQKYLKLKEKYTYDNWFPYIKKKSISNNIKIKDIKKLEEN